MNPPQAPAFSGSIAGVLLAAGRAERFGADKLLVPFADGAPVLAGSAAALRPAVDRLVAVVAPGQPERRRLLEGLGAEVTETASGGGLGDSLASGIAASADAAGWVVALGDMPFVRLDTVRAVGERLRAGAGLVVPEHAGRPGHPRGFAARWGPVLAACRGDRGPREAVAARLRETGGLPVGDPGVLRDIDHPTDLEGE